MRLTVGEYAGMQNDIYMGGADFGPSAPCKVWTDDSSGAVDMRF